MNPNSIPGQWCLQYGKNTLANVRQTYPALQCRLAFVDTRSVTCDAGRKGNRKTPQVLDHYVIARRSETTEAQRGYNRLLVKWQSKCTVVGHERPSTDPDRPRRPQIFTAHTQHSRALGSRLGS